VKLEVGILEILEETVCLGEHMTIWLANARYQTSGCRGERVTTTPVGQPIMLT